jgi:hypothetical protein
MACGRNVRLDYHSIKGNVQRLISPLSEARTLTRVTTYNTAAQTLVVDSEPGGSEELEEHNNQTSSHSHIQIGVVGSPALSEPLHYQQRIVGQDSISGPQAKLALTAHQAARNAACREHDGKEA